ncbi:hypothetical protein L484_024429 [Morus notabilis]|uniref:Uncharacterized protein n=1 Tax=Morus notabilis TaxID=981085 RepID=W9RX49_9ROSA|nr:uncharacterized protein LOC21407168 [Morus notabilis]EXC16255.1 hypothetical protein L484_024429 [Morus notabilis]
MKLSAKSLSSPGRTEKFPPPLMRFLRTNVGSKSRGRSRSSPMFVRKKNSNNTAIETQEPSSPKVTCMGQVRVKRSKTTPKSPQQQQPSCRCQWIPRKSLFFRHFPGKITRPKLCRPVWSKWASFFQLSFRRKVGIRGKNQSEKIASSRSEDSEEEDEEEKEKEPIFLSSLSPPKNALILTRCRSAPYRSSSLACRFWGSPLNSEEEQKKAIENRQEEEEAKEEEEEEDDDDDEKKPSSEMERLSCEEAKVDSEIEEMSRVFKEFDGKRLSESSKTGEEIVDRPLILTRCKSEPARTGEKLDPELSFWRNRRLGIVNSCSASVL